MAAGLLCALLGLLLLDVDIVYAICRGRCFGRSVWTAVGCGDLDVYRQHILNAGVCRPVEVNEAAANTLVTSWSSHGIGWLAERLDYGAHEGFVLFHLYYGSSTYDTKQMSRLLDSVIEDCKEQGIQTLTPNEIARMKATWRAERI